MDLTLKLFIFTFFVLITTSYNQTRRDPASEQLLRHKRKQASCSIIQTNWGTPVDDIDNVLTVGKEGPMIMQDTIALDVLLRFVRNRIPPRFDQAKGAGAVGYFITTNDITRYSKAVVFKRIGKKTPVAVRFCVLGSERGTQDTVRAPRGFSIKFYTEDGIWDLTTASNPTIFVNNPLKFLHAIRSLGRNPVTNLRDFDAKWDYNTLHPESVFDVMYTFGEAGRPDGYRHCNFFGQNIYKMSNSDGIDVYIKYHLKTNQGFRSLSPEAAKRLMATDPDYATRDLYNNIARGNFPSWTLYIQVMTYEQAERYPFNPFDTVRPWPEKDFPLIEVGKIVLNKNPKNFFSDVEQIAFNPGHMIPGIEASPDKLLQGRFLAYIPAQQYRLGTNFDQLPINRPFKKGVTNYQSGGQGEIYNQDGAPTYYPNSFKGPKNEPRAAISTFHWSGDIAVYNITPPDTSDLARDYWMNISEQEKENLVKSLVSEISRTAGFIKKRAIRMFMGVDEDLGRRIKRGVYA